MRKHYFYFYNKIVATGRRLYKYIMQFMICCYIYVTLLVSYLHLVPRLALGEYDTKTHASSIQSN